MSIEARHKTIVKLTIPLSSDPVFFNVEDRNTTISQQLEMVADSFEDDNRTHEAMQLRQLMNDHVPFVKGQMVPPGTVMSALAYSQTVVDNIPVDFVEMTLLKQHVGGKE